MQFYIVKYNSDTNIISDISEAPIINENNPNFNLRKIVKKEYENGIYEGPIINGKRNGKGKMKYKSGDIIIKQGENGDVLYCIEEGECECYKKIENEEKSVKKYQSGDSFGELALLYNSPRAATVKAISDVITWCLDRETFNHIVKDAAQKKREKYENFLKKVDILSTIEPYELMQISDAIKTGNFKKDDYIIKEDEMGDVFYILEEGNCIATKTLEKGKPETKIKDYKEGDYFGERALIKGEPNIIYRAVKG